MNAEKNLARLIVKHQVYNHFKSGTRCGGSEEAADEQPDCQGAVTVDAVAGGLPAGGGG